jgi:hypothetical protein
VAAILADNTPASYRRIRRRRYPQGKVRFKPPPVPQDLLRSVQPRTPLTLSIDLSPFLCPQPPGSSPLNASCMLTAARHHVGRNPPYFRYEWRYPTLAQHGVRRYGNRETSQTILTYIYRRANDKSSGDSETEAPDPSRLQLLEKTWLKKGHARGLLFDV